MQIAILVFERITALDAVGPYEVLSRLPDADVRFVAPEIGPKRTDEGSLVLLAEDRLDDVPAPDIVVVPGGVGEVDMRADEDVQDWLRSVHQTTSISWIAPTSGSDSPRCAPSRSQPHSRASIAANGSTRRKGPPPGAEAYTCTSGARYRIRCSTPSITRT